MTSQRKQMLICTLCAIVAAAAVFAYTASMGSEALAQRTQALERYGGEQVEVVVASADIEVGAKLTLENTTLRTWVVDLLPQGDVARSASQTDGRIAQTDIKKNEPVLMERIGDGNSRISVPDGLEAVSVSSDDVLAVGGAIRPGSLVDVYVETSKGTIVLLGQNILVLETNGAEGEASSNDKLTWVTLAVTPASTHDLLSASIKGTIHLVLPSANAGKAGQQ